MNNEELILQMLGKISDKLEEHDKHFESIDNHFESIDNRFESIDNRFESLETDVRHTRMLIEKQEHNVQLIAEQYGDISAKLERVREIDELRDRVRTLETVSYTHLARHTTSISFIIDAAITKREIIAPALHAGVPSLPEVLRLSLIHI